MTLQITWDNGTWLYLPIEFPYAGYPDEDAWIDTIRRAFRRARWKRRELDGLELYLRGLRANNAAGAHRFTHLEDPRRVQQIVDVHEAPHDPAVTVHDMTGSDGIDTDARPPVVAELVARGLGPGLRVERALRAPITTHERLGAEDGPTEVILMTFWVFRSEDTDVVVTATQSDAVAFAAVIPDIEELIDGIARDGDAADEA